MSIFVPTRRHRAALATVTLSVVAVAACGRSGERAPDPPSGTAAGSVAAKAARPHAVTVEPSCPPDTLPPGVMCACAPGYSCECLYEAYPFCCDCVPVECDAGYELAKDCDGNAACVPTVCEGFAGLVCPEGFACERLSNNPDEGGSCRPACACGPCISDDDCGQGESCTAEKECLSWCQCPACDVCAGRCVAAP
jgi:hypothetical protein